MKRPSFQFYPADWRKDAALQSCSVAAQGLWINAMCIAHECEPYGHLTVNGRPMTPAQLARLVGLALKECEALLAELEDAGVSARNAAGALYSRRMVRDEASREKRANGGYAGAEHGEKGASFGGKGGRPRKDGGGFNNPPPGSQTGDEEPPNKPPPSSSSSSSVIQTDNLTQAEVSCVDGLEPTQLGAVYAALRDAGVTDANPGDPVLKVMVEQGVDVAEWRAAAAVSLKAGRSDMAYVVGVVRNKRADASKLKLAPAAQPVHTVTVASNDAEITRQRLEAEAKRPFGLPSEEQRAKIAEARQAARLAPVGRAQA